MADEEPEEKPARPLIDDWIWLSDKAGIALKMFENGTVLIEHKVIESGTRKYRTYSKLVLPWPVVERIRQNYKRYKAVKEGAVEIKAADSLVAETQAGMEKPKEIIKIRCKNCKTLNDEDAKFCKKCGMKV